MDTNLYSVCKLTAEQKKAFNKLKKAYRECEKVGIYFANCYGDLMAFDNKLVAGYGDDSMLPDEWADDTHVLGLTKKGMELYLSDEE